MCVVVHAWSLHFFVTFICFVKAAIDHDADNRTVSRLPALPSYQTLQRNPRSTTSIKQLKLDNEREKRYIKYDHHQQFSSTYVLRGRQTLLFCITNEASSKLLDPKIEWSRPARAPAMDSRFRQGEDGTLTIIDAEPRDYGKYTCTVTGTDTTQHRVKRQYAHLLIVFVLPNLNYLCNMKYRTSFCDESLKHTKISHIKSKLWESIRYAIKDMKGSCHSVSDGRIRQELWIQFNIFPPDNMVLPKCGVHCMTRSVKKKIDARLVALNNFVEREAPHNVNGLHIKSVDLRVKLETPCPSGYKKDGALCSPCPPGSVSGDGDVACTLCPQGSYQPEFALAQCIQCPEGTNTQDEGTVSPDKCEEQGVVVVSTSTKSALGSWIAILFLLKILMVGGAAFAGFKLYKHSKKGGGPKKKESEEGIKEAIATHSKHHAGKSTELLLPKPPTKRTIQSFFTKMPGLKKVKVKTSKTSKNTEATISKTPAAADKTGVYLTLPERHPSSTDWGDDFSSNEPLYMDPVVLRASKQGIQPGPKTTQKVHKEPSYARLGTPPPPPPPLSTLPKLPDSVKSNKSSNPSSERLYATVDSVNLLKVNSHKTRSLDRMFDNSDRDIPPPLPPPRGSKAKYPSARPPSRDELP